MTQPEQEAREMLAKLLFVWGERAGGNADFSVDSDSVRYWFAQQSEARGEDAFCFSHCEELRAQADFLIRNFAAFAARRTAGIDREVSVADIAIGLKQFRAVMADPELAGDDETAFTSAIEAMGTAAKTGERGAVIEECARIADERAASREQLFEENGASINAAKAVQAEEIAAAIRALSQPLPDAPIVGEGEKNP